MWRIKSLKASKYSEGREMNTIQDGIEVRAKKLMNNKLDVLVQSCHPAADAAVAWAAEWDPLFKKEQSSQNNPKQGVAAHARNLRFRDR